ncbi:hypothetical protein CDAR_560731 [Caerostris darwini]|uniref:Uncharacterized protein n=1 Tax=Caerostris darwini TaxID=1538125 RepID=A0AAV4PIG2_9ARAC|nr:hypothetical protein CDAR_560641 [Caerostris darwini]GIX94902.1 hypothetical protein CDAR_560731 [Caerostris darwini]
MVRPRKKRGRPPKPKMAFLDRYCRVYLERCDEMPEYKEALLRERRKAVIRIRKEKKVVLRKQRGAPKRQKKQETELLRNIKRGEMKKRGRKKKEVSLKEPRKYPRRTRKEKKDVVLKEPRKYPRRTRNEKKNEICAPTLYERKDTEKRTVAHFVPVMYLEIFRAYVEVLRNDQYAYRMVSMLHEKNIDEDFLIFDSDKILVRIPNKQLVEWIMEICNISDIQMEVQWLRICNALDELNHEVMNRIVPEKRKNWNENALVRKSYYGLFVRTVEKTFNLKQDDTVNTLKREVSKSPILLEKGPKAKIFKTNLPHQKSDVMTKRETPKSLKRKISEEEKGILQEHEGTLKRLRTAHTQDVENCFDDISVLKRTQTPVASSICLTTNQTAVSAIEENTSEIKENKKEQNETFGSKQFFSFSSKDNQTENVRFYSDLSVSTTDESSHSNEDFTSLKENKEQNKTFGNNELLSFSPKDNQRESAEFCEDLSASATDESSNSNEHFASLKENKEQNETFGNNELLSFSPKDNQRESAEFCEDSSANNQRESAEFCEDLSASATDESSNSNEHFASLKENKEQNETFGNNELLCFSPKDNQRESAEFCKDLSASATDESSNSNEDFASLNEHNNSESRTVEKQIAMLEDKNKNDYYLFENAPIANEELKSGSTTEEKYMHLQVKGKNKIGKDESCSSFSNKSDISDHKDVSDVFVAKNIAGDDYEDILTEEEDDSEERKELFNELLHNNDVKESTSTKSIQNETNITEHEENRNDMTAIEDFMNVKKSENIYRNNSTDNSESSVLEPINLVVEKKQASIPTSNCIESQTNENELQLINYEYQQQVSNIVYGKTLARNVIESMTLEREYVNNNNTTNQITNRNESRGCNTSITSRKECRNYVSSLTGFTNIIETQAVYQQVFVDIGEKSLEQPVNNMYQNNLISKKDLNEDTFNENVENQEVLDINAKNVARDAKENLPREEEGSLDYEEPEPLYSEINDPESDDNVNRNSLTSNNVWYEHKLYDTSKERISGQDEKYVETGNHTSQWTGRRELNGCNASISSRRVWRGWRQLSVTQSEQRVNDLSAITGFTNIIQTQEIYGDVLVENSIAQSVNIMHQNRNCGPSMLHGLRLPFYSDISDEEQSNADTQTAEEDTQDNKDTGKFSDISNEEYAAGRLNIVDQNNQCNSAQYAPNNLKPYGPWYYHYNLNPNYHNQKCNSACYDYNNVKCNSACYDYNIQKCNSASYVYNNQKCNSAWYDPTLYYTTNEGNGRQEASDKIDAVNYARDAEDDVSIKGEFLGNEKTVNDINGFSNIRKTQGIYGEDIGQKFIPKSVNIAHQNNPNYQYILNDNKFCNENIDNQQPASFQHIPGNVKADLLMTQEEPVDYSLCNKPVYPDIINEDQNNIDMLSAEEDSMDDGKSNSSEFSDICDDEYVAESINTEVQNNLKASNGDKLFNKLKENTESQDDSDIINAKNVARDGKEYMKAEEKENYVNQLMYRNKLNRHKAFMQSRKQCGDSESDESSDDVTTITGSSNIIETPQIYEDISADNDEKSSAESIHIMHKNNIKSNETLKEHISFNNFNENTGNQNVSDIAKAKTVAADGKDHMTVEGKYEEDEKFINPLMGRNELKGCRTFMSSKKQLSDSESEDSLDDVATSTSSREQSSDSESHEKWNDGTTSTPPRKQRRVSEPEDSLNDVTTSEPSRKQMSDLEYEQSVNDVITITDSPNIIETPQIYEDISMDNDEKSNSENVNITTLGDVKNHMTMEMCAEEHENFINQSSGKSEQNEFCFMSSRKQQSVSKLEESLNDVTSSTPSRKQFSDHGYEQNLNDATITTDFPNITETHEVYEGVSADNGDTSNAESINIMHQNNLKSCEDLNYNKLTDKLNEEFGKQEASDAPESKERLNDVTTGTCSPIILETTYEDITTDDEKIMAEYINKHQNNNKALDEDKIPNNFNDSTENQEVSDIINAKAVEEDVREVIPVEDNYFNIQNFSTQWKERTEFERYKTLMKSRNNTKKCFSKETTIIDSRNFIWTQGIVYEELSEDSTEKTIAEYIKMHQNNKKTNEALNDDELSSKSNESTENQEDSFIINAKTFEKTLKEFMTFEETCTQDENFVNALAELKNQKMYKAFKPLRKQWSDTESKDRSNNVTITNGSSNIIENSETKIKQAQGIYEVDIGQKCIPKCVDITYQNNSKSNNVLNDCEFSSENIGNQQANFMHKEQSSYVSKEGIGNQQADFMHKEQSSYVSKEGIGNQQADFMHKEQSSYVSKEGIGNQQADFMHKEQSSYVSKEGIGNQQADFKYKEQSNYCKFSDISDDECVAESINTTAENNLKSSNTLIGDKLFNELQENTENHEVSNIINAKTVARDDKESITVEENETSINPLTNRNELKEHNTFMQSGVQQLSDSESEKMVEVTPFTPFRKRWSECVAESINTTAENNLTSNNAMSGDKLFNQFEENTENHEVSNIINAKNFVRDDKESITVEENETSINPLTNRNELKEHNTFMQSGVQQLSDSESEKMVEVTPFTLFRKRWSECVAESINTTAENNLTSNNAMSGEKLFNQFEENTENHEVSNIINAKNFVGDDKESITVEENETSINPLTNRNELKEHNTFMQSGVQQLSDSESEEMVEVTPFTPFRKRWSECVAESINTTAENNLTSNNAMSGEKLFNQFEENTENHEVSNIINAKNFVGDDKESITVEENETSINPLTNRNELKEHNTFMQSGVQQLSDSESEKMVEVTPFTPFSKRWSDAEPKQCLNTTRTDFSNLIKTPDIDENVSSDIDENVSSDNDENVSSDNDEKSIAESVNITYQNNLKPSNALNETIFFQKFNVNTGNQGFSDTVNAKNVAGDVKENLLREEEMSVDCKEPEPPMYSDISDPEEEGFVENAPSRIGYSNMYRPSFNEESYHYPRQNIPYMNFPPTPRQAPNFYTFPQLSNASYTYKSGINQYWSDNNVVGNFPSAIYAPPQVSSVYNPYPSCVIEESILRDNSTSEETQSTSTTDSDVQPSIAAPAIYAPDSFAPFHTLSTPPFHYHNVLDMNISATKEIQLNENSDSEELTENDDQDKLLDYCDLEHLMESDPDQYTTNSDSEPKWNDFLASVEDIFQGRQYDIAWYESSSPLKLQALSSESCDPTICGNVPPNEDSVLESLKHREMLFKEELHTAANHESAETAETEKHLHFTKSVGNYYEGQQDLYQYLGVTLDNGRNLMWGDKEGQSWDIFLDNNRGTFSSYSEEKRDFDVNSHILAMTDELFHPIGKYTSCHQSARTEIRCITEIVD